MSRAQTLLLPERRRQVNHRALSRFGLVMGKLVRHSLIDRVHKGDVKYARKLTHSRTVVVLDYAGKELSFIYSSASKEILAFLDPNAPETEAWRCSQATARALFAAKDCQGPIPSGEV